MTRATVRTRSFPTAMSKTPKQKEEKFEEALGKLEEMVGKLEEGNLPLEESLKIFEEGLRLAKFCGEKLDQAQGKVEMLTKNGK